MNLKPHGLPAKERFVAIQCQNLSAGGYGKTDLKARAIGIC